MKKVFESKYGTEVEELKKHLEDKCFESQIHETFENFELLVDENIYDEVLTEINGMKKKLSGTAVVDKKPVTENKSNQYEKGSFEYLVEEFFHLSFLKLLLLSALYSLVVSIGFAIYVICKFGLEKTFRTNAVLAFAGAFCMTMILSLFVLLPARYYRVFSIVNEVFTICSVNKDSDAEERHKNLVFIKAIIGLIVILCGAIYIFCDALAQ
ncbi:MAG: hypothetical protein IJJ66_07100 [Treponema sp.]|nr:hypothetical protein [Treponema sp.]